MVTVALVEFDVAQARINCSVHPDKIHRQLSSSRLANGRLNAYHSVIAMSLLHPALLILTLFIVLRLRSMKVKLPFHHKRCHHSVYGVGVGGTTSISLCYCNISTPPCTAHPNSIYHATHSIGVKFSPPLFV